MKPSNAGYGSSMHAFARQRRAEVEPVLEQLHAWLPKKALQVPQSIAVGKAVNYTLGQWPKLLRYLDLPKPTPAPCSTASARPLAPTNGNRTGISAECCGVYRTHERRRTTET